MPESSIATPVAPVANIPSRPQFAAALSKEQADLIEKALAEHHRTRWLMLLFLRFDSEPFIEKMKGIINDNEDICVEAIEALEDYIEKLEALLGLANSAFARFISVGEYLTQGA